MKRKIVGIFFVMLLITSVTSVVGFQVEQNEKQLCGLKQKGDFKSVSVSGCMSTSFSRFEASGLSQKILTYNEISIQSVDEDVIDMVQQLDETMYLGYLENLTAFGPRVTGTSECEAAGSYIYNEFQSMGLDVRFQDWSYEGYSDRNIEATLAGTDGNSDEIYIISAHYDCKGGPGADDDGSGVAAVLSAAYIMSQYEFNHAVRFVTFSGEEQGLLGSHEYVEEINGDNIIGVLNADAIGYAVTELERNNILVCENAASQWLTSFIGSISQQYNEYVNLGVLRCGPWEYSDHASFWEIGYDALWYVEVANSPYWHTPQDTIENMDIDYAVRGSKLLLASLAELANSNISSLPKKPSISGSEEGEIEEELTFSTRTTDPNNRQLSYVWDWGDGTQSEWSGPYDSGILVSASHSWTEKGIYPIKVKAKNTDELESDWSNLFLIGIPRKNEGVDQKQVTNAGYGYGTWLGGQFAQSFIPTVETITKVSLHLFKKGEPLGVTVSIRSNLNEKDLTSAYLLGSDIEGQLKGNWYEFNFPEIEIIPGETYYIVWTPDGQDAGNVIYWTFGDNNPYPNGHTWVNLGYVWEELEIPDTDDPDFCFKTYYAHNKPRNRAIKNPFIQFLQSHPNLFPILKLLLQRFGLQ